MDAGGGEVRSPPVATLAGRQIRCVLFDLGNTLWHRRDAAVIAALEREGNARAVALVWPLLRPSDALSADEDSLEAFGVRVRREVQAEMWRRSDVDRTREPDFAEVATEGLHNLGLAGLENAERSLGAAVYEALRVRSVDGRQMFEDALPTLATLAERGLALGIVTNRRWGGAPFEDDLRRMGLRVYIAPQATAVSADLGIRKPHPDIFLHALAGLGIPSVEAAMVGDSLAADVVGANRLGMLSIWKSNGRRLGGAPVSSPASAMSRPSSAAPAGNESTAHSPNVHQEVATSGATLGQANVPDLIIERLADLLELVR